jgi:hypothetical protein
MTGTTTLTTRFGSGGQNPSPTDLESALRELYEEVNPDCTESDYREHPNAWLDFGFQNGEKWSVCTLDVYRSGTILFTRWDDQDDDDPEFEKKIESVPFDKACALWNMLARGDIDGINNEDWDS